MNYKIFDKDGNEINRILADEEFVVRYCEEFGYTYEAEDPVPEVEPEATDTEVINALLGVNE